MNRQSELKSNLCEIFGLTNELLKEIPEGDEGYTPLASTANSDVDFD